MGRGRGGHSSEGGGEVGDEEEAAAFRAKVSSGPRPCPHTPPNSDPRSPHAAPRSPPWLKTLSCTGASELAPPSLPCTPASPGFSPQCPLPLSPLPASDTLLLALLSRAALSFHPPPTLVSPLPSLEHKRKMRKAAVWPLGAG